MRAPSRGTPTLQHGKVFFCGKWIKNYELAKTMDDRRWGSAGRYSYHIVYRPSSAQHPAGGIRMDYSTVTYENFRVSSSEPPAQVRDWSRVASVARVKATLLRAAQDTLDAEGYTQVVAP